ncbi:MAG TPA: hypothetical protein VF559_03300 [Caulobacteraceae bacterium]|jgi:hypothetical protein
MTEPPAPTPTNDPASNPVRAQAVADFARLAFTSLITTCGGGLIAVLSLAAQARPVPAEAAGRLGAAVVCIWAALILALAGAICGYFYLFTAVYRPPERLWLWWAAALSGVFSLITLVAGSLLAFGVVQDLIAAGTAG